ncbi:MAG: FliH/SctL family protein [Phycisphaerae bacterium]
MSSLIKKNTPVVASLYSLADVVAEGDAILEQAQQRARDIETAARAKAVAASTTQAQNGYRAGFQRGYQEGLAALRAEKSQEIRAEAKSRIDALTASVESIIATLERDRHALYAEAETGIIELSLAIAARICKTQAAHGSDVARNNARALLQQARGTAPIVIETSAADFEALQELIPALAARVNPNADVRLSAVDALRQGDIRLRHGRCEIDATIDEQLRRVAAALLPSSIVENDSEHSS